MQHPDEGTIHSWLDGALSADEAARVEAHVKECPECAAAVAEARGFIAGASRILTALDNAPRGVIPAAAPKKRIDPWVWRVAATVLVVAAGTLVVVRNPGNDKQSISMADTSTMSRQGVLTSERVSAVMEPAQDAPNASLPKAGAAGAPIAAAATAPRTAADKTVPGATQSNARKEVRTNPGARDLGSGNPSENEVLEKRGVTRAPQAAAAPGFAATAPLAPVVTAAPRVTTGSLGTDSAGQPEPLKVVGTPRRIGAKVTLYEVAPGDTVTLTEAISISLDAVVVTGASASQVMARGASKAARPTDTQSKVRPDTAVAEKASDSSRAAGAVTSAPPIAARALSAQQAGIADALHAISWTDAVTKNTLTLTGRMPEARLQEIRIRIERERAAAAAAAAAKKNP